MTSARDFTGQRFGRLTAISVSPYRKHGKRHWHCICDCGGKATVAERLLCTGQTTPCGCVRQLKCPATEKTKTDETGAWYAQRKAAKYIEDSYAIIAVWAKGCPWLENQAIQARRIASANQREVTYCLKAYLA
jgi:hypothetical protein